jgi:hypothetical protein
MAVGVGAGLHAQSTTSSKDESSVMVTGCLQPGTADRGAVGTSGTSTGTPSADAARSSSTAGSGFVLVNAKSGGAPGGGSGVTSVAPPGSGTTPSAARAGSTQPSPGLIGAVDSNGEPNHSASATYRLRGDNPELPRHVGQEVEISGRLIPASGAASASGSSASSSSTTTSSATGTAGTSGTSASGAYGSAQEIEVQSIRMIASVCAATK